LHYGRNDISRVRVTQAYRTHFMNLQRIVLVVLSAALVTARGSHAAPAAATQAQIAPYMTPQHLVQVGKGRAINLVCLGHGSPTVVLSAGLDAWSVWWWRVQPVLAKRTRVCSWDRAGIGFSSPSLDPQDLAHTTADLERALNGAGIRGPYVMVGHSLGGLEALRFTDLHRRSVVGMILVDPEIPDRAAVEERFAPRLATLWRASTESVVKHLQHCATELRKGTLKSGTPQFEQCTAVQVPLPESLKAAIARLNADPERLLTQASTEKEHHEDAREVMNAKRRYGDMPLIVLTAGRDESSALSSLPDMPGARTPAELTELRKEIRRFLHDGWDPAHDAYAALSTRGSNQLVPDSGHNIPINNPEVVISAVNEVLEEIRPTALHGP
jgi:pimeloyl-ACP methyl ester carboxylesterase